MKVLVVGGGGREHALAWKLGRSADCEQLYCAPGNPGTAAIATNVAISDSDVAALADFAEQRAIGLTVVGPEVPLALGIVDEFHRRGLTIFGPSRYAAQLESSKIFAKQFMLRCGIPTAVCEVVESAIQAQAAIDKIGLPLVFKADGLAAGKGVLIVHSVEEAAAAMTAFFDERRFGASGDRVLVEPFLEGEEVSIMGLSDGRNLLPLATSKDYKRIGEGDSGPNTGGMGSHSPSGVVSPELEGEILDTVLRPTVAAMADEGQPLVGVVYAGLMLTADGPKVLEFNIRLGDPEAQVILLRLEDDLLGLLARGAAGDFETERLTFRPQAAACIVLASAGYPGTPVKGERITGIDAAGARSGVEVFHAGTSTDEDGILSSGGRVLNVCALGDDLSEALDRAYDAASLIDWPSKVLRRDIGRRVLV
jgi:phosphoribosylamine--glycine ligase